MCDVMCRSPQNSSTCLLENLFENSTSAWHAKIIERVELATFYEILAILHGMRKVCEGTSTCHKNVKPSKENKYQQHAKYLCFRRSLDLRTPTEWKWMQNTNLIKKRRNIKFLGWEACKRESKNLSLYVFSYNETKSRSKKRPGIHPLWILAKKVSMLIEIEKISKYWPVPLWIETFGSGCFALQAEEKEKQTKNLTKCVTNRALTCEKSTFSAFEISAKLPVHHIETRITLSMALFMITSHARWEYLSRNNSVLNFHSNWHQKYRLIKTNPQNEP